MTRPLSNDLRERVVAAVCGGESCRSVASRFGVAVSSVVKWSQRYRATGSVVPSKMGGAPQAGVGAASHFHPATNRPNAAPDAAWAQGRTCGAWDQRLPQCGVAVLAARGPELQKKRCSPLSRPVPTSPAGGGAGAHGRRASTPSGWSSSTRPGSRPIWLRSVVGGRRASGCAPSYHTATGGR
jgi:hypothetical protein